MSLYEENILEDEGALTRFWDKVEIIRPDDPDACYDWTAKKDKNGCGILCMFCPQLGKTGPRGWKSFRAPRLMWILENDKPIPDGLQVLHRCDNETCTNPRHLYLGTPYDNMQDRKVRGRYHTGPKGENHYTAILTEAKVRKICHLYFVQRKSQRQIAEKVNIKQGTINSVIRGRSWKHITKTHIPKGFLHKYKYCAVRNEKMYRAFKNGATYQELAKQYKTSLKNARDIVLKKKKEYGDAIRAGRPKK